MIKESDFLKVSFVKSIKHNDQQPNDNLPEIAFAGRSNVGKSSLLNAIFQRKNLVKTSSTPGKTQLINYFNVNDKFYCVDLPGYGYAKISKSQKASWQPMIESFLLKNRQLKMIYVLIDSRHDFMQSDNEMLTWLSHFALNFKVVLSKTDKISKNELYRKISEFGKLIPEINILPFSFKNNGLIADLRRQIISDL